MTDPARDPIEPRAGAARRTEVPSLKHPEVSIVTGNSGPPKFATRRVPGWQAMSRLGRSRIVKTSYIWLFLVPIAASALSHVPDQVTISVLGASFCVNVGLPFSWKLFYLGALCFTAGSILYSWRCPSLIRNYQTLAEFQSHSRAKYDILWGFAELLNELPALKSTALVPQFLMTTTLRDHDVARRECMEALQSGDLLTIMEPEIDLAQSSDAFALVRSASDLRRPVFRSIAWCCYSVGLLAAALVIIQGAIAVWGVVGR